MNDKKTEEPDSKAKAQRVWTVHDGQLAPITITKGLSDGVRTEVVSGQVEPGMALVTDEVIAGK
jgi:HlyD family secretion protein